MAREPRKGTFDYMTREVAEREGWTERKAAAILKDGIVNGKDSTLKHRRSNAEGIEEMRERGEA